MKSDFKGDEMSGEVDKQRTGEPEFIDTFKSQLAGVPGREIWILMYYICTSTSGAQSFLLQLTLL